MSNRRAKAEGRLAVQRDMIVYVPPGYPRPDVRYPVLYMQDGQNLFDPETAFGGQDWEADRTADELIERGEIRPLIIAGVYHAGVRRIEEYTEGGGRYIDRLVSRVKPMLDAKWRTDRTAAIGGSSLGGLVAMRAGLRYPRLFDKLAVISPSVWWDGRAIVKMVRAYRSPQRAKIWLDAGTEESPEMIPDLRMLQDALLEKGWGNRLEYREYAGANHSERAWRERFGDVLRWLFPPGL